MIAKLPSNGEGAIEQIRSRLLLAVVVFAAAAPFTGWKVPLIWLALTVLAIGVELYMGRNPPNPESPEIINLSPWPILQNVMFAIAPLYIVMFYTGAAQAFAVVLYGVLKFEVLIRDYTNRRQLWINLVPSIVSLVIVQVAAVAWRIERGEPLQVITVLAGPFVVFWVFRSIYRDLTRSRRRLSEAVARAEAAASAKAAFLSNMSHEIRTPLTSILGFAGLLRDVSGLPPAASRYADRIATAGETLLSLVNDILDYSKIDAGQLGLAPHPFEIRRLIEETIDLISAMAAGKGLAVTSQIDPDVPDFLFADSFRVRQVLLNLLTNAIKFTEQGGATVTASYSGQGGGQLRVSVIDTGCGVPAVDVEHLFQRFYQVDGSTSRMHGGAGLGLAICRSLATLMGGEAGVESREGAGSTFWFTIAAPPAEAPAQIPQSEAGEGGMRPARVLVVDDVAVNRELVSVLLTAVGHQVSVAPNGRHALEAARREQFDLILMDLQMPGMDGLEATRAIRSEYNLNRETPILALSANAMATHKADCAAAGMNDHISKPIDLATLLTKVSQWTLTGEDRAQGPNGASSDASSGSGRR